MQNFTQYPQFISFYVPIWITPGLYNSEGQFVTTFQALPEFVASEVMQCPNENHNTQGETQKQGDQIIQAKQKVEENIVVIEKEPSQHSNKGLAKNQLVQDTKKKDQKDINNIKRPLTYETERSYYMKQKLKGKLRLNQRILRKRITQNTNIPIKSKLRVSNVKNSTIQQKKIKKEHKTVVNQIKKHKIQKKKKEKISLQLYEYLAKVPSLIIGFRQLNQFIQRKREHLKLRKVDKK